jgi:hypothetical protein
MSSRTALDRAPDLEDGLVLQPVHGALNVDGQATPEEGGQGRIGQLAVGDL